MSDITQEQVDAAMVVLKRDSSNILNFDLSEFFEGKEIAIETIEAERQQHIKRIEEKEKALKECLDCILRPDNGVTDIIWYSDFCTLAEHIACSLDEDIDFEAVALAQSGVKVKYRCPKTTDFELKEANQRIEELEGALRTVPIMINQSIADNYGRWQFVGGDDATEIKRMCGSITRTHCGVTSLKRL